MVSMKVRTAFAEAPPRAETQTASGPLQVIQLLAGTALDPDRFWPRAFSFLPFFSFGFGFAFAFFFFSFYPRLSPTLSPERVNHLEGLAKSSTEAFDEATGAGGDNSMVEQFGVKDSTKLRTISEQSPSVARGPSKAMCDGGENSTIMQFEVGSSPA